MRQCATFRSRYSGCRSVPAMPCETRDRQQLSYNSLRSDTNGHRRSTRNMRCWLAVFGIQNSRYPLHYRLEAGWSISASAELSSEARLAPSQRC
jgi:hypothetical protein